MYPGGSSGNVWCDPCSVSELIKRYRWIRYVGFGGYVRYFGGYSFVNDIVIGLSESPTARDIKPPIKRVPGFILSCVYDRSVVSEALATETVCRLRNNTCTPTVATAAPL